MLALISIVTGVAAGALAFVAASRTPDKATQLRRMGIFYFGLAGLMALLEVL